jgi:hypothetical protein
MVDVKAATQPNIAYNLPGYRRQPKMARLERRAFMATATGPPTGERYIYRPYFTAKSGRRVYAKWYGKKVFKIRVKK